MNRSQFRNRHHGGLQLRSYGLQLRLWPPALLSLITCVLVLWCSWSSPSVSGSPPAESVAIAPTGAAATVKALVQMGPRPTASPVNQQVRSYLQTAYQQAGYVTELQPFSYSQFKDLGSQITVQGTPLPGRAMRGTAAGEVTAAVVVVPGVGKPADFAQVPSRGAIALVQRGEIRFVEKVRHAAAAGAVGVVIVNSDDREGFGVLGESVSLPVLGVSKSVGEELVRLVKAMGDRPMARLLVRPQETKVNGQNLIAYRPGVTQPSLLIGAHYDTVEPSPGANDNGSGTAVLLEVARRLAQEPRNQAWFVAFDGEEAGLYGAKALVETLIPQRKLHLKAMVNLDTVGLNDKLLAGGTPELTAIAHAIDPKIVQFRTNAPTSGLSDHTPFEAANIPVLFFTRGLEPTMHTPQDTAVEPQLLDHTVAIAEGSVRYLLKSGK